MAKPSTVDLWLATQVVVTADGFSPGRDLRHSYVAYCDENGWTPISAPKFRHALSARGLVAEKRGSTWGRLGATLPGEASPRPEPDLKSEAPTSLPETPPAPKSPRPPPPREKPVSVSPVEPSEFVVVSGSYELP